MRVLAIMSKWVTYVGSIPTQGICRNFAQLPNSEWTKMKPNDGACLSCAGG